jgi:hypothetical protein
MLRPVHPPSVVSNAVFVMIVLAVAGMFLSAWRGTGPGAGRSRVLVPLLVALGWLVVPGVLAARGVLDRWQPPPPALVLIGVLTVATVVLALSPVGARFASSVPLAGLVGDQFFRVPVEWTLHRLFVEGVVPVQMTYAGRNFDILSGISAAMVALLLVARRGGRGLVLAWNLVGLGLLANIVVIAALSAPTPLRHFMNEPANRLPGMFPYVWLPTFLVQAALFGHIVVFRVLGRRTT